MRQRTSGLLCALWLAGSPAHAAARAPEGEPVRAAEVLRLGAPPAQEHAPLAAPGLPAPSRALLLEGGSDDESRVSFTWPPLAGAVAYELLVRDAHGVVVRGERVTDSLLALGGLAAGRYRVSVRGLDAQGRPGLESAGVAIHVVGLDIPKTAARGPNGSVRLQDGQRVRPLGAEGLLLAYVGLDEFLPVPESLGLVARHPISLVLLDPESDEKVHLVLEPLEARAEIEFSEHAQTWPAQGLSVLVHLVDDQGSPLPDSFEASCRVTVNVEPAALDWQRSGATLRAQIPRPTGPGPWLVRVEVLDENGAALGRDFSEIGIEPHPRTRQRSAQR